VPERLQAKRRQLTGREKEFLKHRITGKSLKYSAIAAGYSPNYAQQAGSQAMERIQQKAPDLFARLGLDDENYILKHIVPLLEATEVKVFNYNGKLIYSKPLAALKVRARMVELIADLKGLRGAHRPANRTTPTPTLDLPSMPESAQS